MNKERFRIGKVFISKTNPQDTIKKLTEAALNGTGGYVCVTNLRMVMYAGKHPDYAELMDKSFMNLPDGTPLTWCGKAWGLENIAVTNGPATFKEMLSHGDKRLKHFLLGDTQEVLEAIKKKYSEEFGANIVGIYSPPFIDVRDFDYKAIADMIKESGANILWTAMTAPKQDEFDAMLQPYLPDVISVGVGRAFRLAMGELKQAPKWAAKMGIGGFFIRRRKWYKTGWWYLRNTVTVARYILQIKINKMKGQKYYE